MWEQCSSKQRRFFFITANVEFVCYYYESKYEVRLWSKNSWETKFISYVNFRSARINMIWVIKLYFHRCTMKWEYTLCVIIIIKLEEWTIINCLGLGHETMVCTVCLSIFLLIESHVEFGSNSVNIHSVVATMRRVMIVGSILVRRTQNRYFYVIYLIIYTLSGSLTQQNIATREPFSKDALKQCIYPLLMLASANCAVTMDIRSNPVVFGLNSSLKMEGTQ